MIGPSIKAMSTRSLASKALCVIFGKWKKPKEVVDDLCLDCDRRERAFLMELVYGVMRYKVYLDWILGHFLEKTSGLSDMTLNNLRVAIYQMKFMRVPEFAIVNEAVNTEKNFSGRASLVNAVLRNYLRYKNAVSLPPEEDPVLFISVVTSHPPWLVRRWIKRFGYDEALKFTQKNNEMPPLTIRTEESEREQALAVLIAKGLKASPTKYSAGGINLEAHLSFSELSGILHVNFNVQDEAAQLVTYLLNPSPGERILDACAAPGGKTTHIAELMKDTGEIVAVESEEKRIRQLSENISRSGKKSVCVIQSDIRAVQEHIGRTTLGLFDRIILDAPCSAIGVIRRNPDVKYRHTRKDLLRFQKNQLDMLGAVSELLKPGGTIVYSVCSTEPEEGEDVIKAFLQGKSNFSIIEGSLDCLRPFKKVVGELTFYRTFPHVHNMDGFFAARLKRIR